MMLTRWLLPIIPALLHVAYASSVNPGESVCCHKQYQQCVSQGASGCGINLKGFAECVDNHGPTSTCSTVCPTHWDYAWQIHGAPDGDCLCTDYDPSTSKYCYGS
nr:uncharacterized protein CTRU02_09091 [Colletotrichum truncatum]KAF6789299.1 hypothetical protein CTRU02_09091 [Colletotrichum truncatum]